MKWYRTGGCFSLGLAIQEETGLPAELYYLQGRPTHAYIVDHDFALDARGRTELRLARLGAERVARGDADELRRWEALVVPDPRDLPEVREAAARAAQVVLALA